ncbi:MAG: hypothetical protein Q4B26_04760 [Eubacteriales bacterium]|nr:hypothetical protein [Eubacteriales bacterium]
MAESNKKQTQLYECFGEMDSFEEINELAENLLNEGDNESIYKMAEENGIDREYVDMYVEGETLFLCEADMAAMGKLTVEVGQVKLSGIFEDWLEYIRTECLESPEMAIAVRRRGKSLKGCLAKLLKWSFGHQVEVDKAILSAAKVTASRVTLGIPNMGTAKKIIRKYYLEDKA